MKLGHWKGSGWAAHLYRWRCQFSSLFGGLHTYSVSSVRVYVCVRVRVCTALSVCQDFVTEHGACSKESYILGY